MEYQKIKMKELEVLYLRRVGAYGEENRKLMENFKYYIRKEGLLDSDAEIFGIARDNPAVTESDKCRYDIAIKGKKDMVSDNSIFEEGTLDGGLYCAFLIQHTAEGVQQFWNDFFDILVSAHFIFDDQRLILEVYQQTLVDKGYCQMYVPIKDK